MSTRIITDPAEWRVGDHAVLTYEQAGATITVDGSLSLIPHGRALVLGGPTGWCVRWPDGTIRTEETATVTREDPDLPTEPGSVIMNATIRGVPGCTAMLDVDGHWVTSTGIDDDHYWHKSEHITAWTPARIVADGEPATR